MIVPTNPAGSTMATVLLVIHLMIAAALVGVVLLQRSEGGALGMGGGGGFMAGRGQANVLTRATAVLAAAFFATSILLTILARQTGGPSPIPSLGGGADGGGLSTLQPIEPVAPATPVEPSAPQSK